MGLFDKLRGIKRPEDGVAAVPATELTTRLLGLNRDSAPWLVRPATADEQADLVAEWKIVDASWYQVFAKAGLERTFKVLMRLDESKHEVRSTDQEWTVSWEAGVPTIAMAASGFRGQKTEVSFGTAVAFTEELEFGKVYEYKFRTGEIKRPLQDTVTSSGWTWDSVAFGKL